MCGKATDGRTKQVHRVLQQSAIGNVKQSNCNVMHIAKYTCGLSMQKNGRVNNGHDDFQTAMYKSWDCGGAEASSKLQVRDFNVKHYHRGKCMDWLTSESEGQTQTVVRRGATDRDWGIQCGWFKLDCWGKRRAKCMPTNAFLLSANNTGALRCHLFGGTVGAAFLSLRGLKNSSFFLSYLFMFIGLKRSLILLWMGPLVSGRWDVWVSAGR